MKNKLALFLLVLVIGLATVIPAFAADEPFTVGMLMVGPYNDKGWSQAHYDAFKYVEEKIGADKINLVYVDNAYTGSYPGMTVEQLADDLLDQGADLMIFNSDDQKDDAINFAKNNPDIPVIHASGDSGWEEGKNYAGLENMRTYMPAMEYGEAMGGCLAALRSETGKIGYIGPLINDETRRFANATYLGAKYCWENYLGKDAKDLQMKVTWIGFWFNIPGVTSDPSQVADEFVNSGYDVLISALDTTEALVQADKANKAGKNVFAVAYDYKDACAEAPDVCLGVRYFNWGPEYLRVITGLMNGEKMEPGFLWENPDWADINNPDTSSMGFINGTILTEEESGYMSDFIEKMAADGSMKIFSGPLNWQDGTEFLADGVEATPYEIWYSGQLLEGMEGQSVSE